MVYCATSPALAALETFVHLMPQQRVFGKMPKMWLIELDVSDQAVWQGGGLPDQHLEPRSVGDHFLERAMAVGMKVPSLIIAQDTNVLLNPVHLQFAETVKVIATYDFAYDHRLVAAVQS